MPSPSPSAMRCPISCRVCWRGGASPRTTCRTFLDPALKRLLPDPSVLTAMDAAAARIADAVIAGEAMAVFGDYDVDGATSSALFARYVRAVGRDPVIYIPDRHLRGLRPEHRGASVARQSPARGWW